MLVDTLQAEFVRAQLHPENLSIFGKNDRLVAWRDSLLRSWYNQGNVTRPTIAARHASPARAASI
jgi:hypothetical protein